MENKIENIIWIFVSLLAIIVTVAIVISVLFGGRYYSGGYGPYAMMGGFYGMWIIMPVMGIILLILGMIFIYFIIETIRTPVKYNHSDDISIAEEIAKERLARGDISEEEYRRIIQNIRK